MSLSALDWSHVQSFLAVMEGGSLSAASRQLGTAQATVRRHIEAIEGALATTLFARTPGGLIPTDAARAALPQAQAIAAGMAALVRSVRGSDRIEGVVRVTCSGVVGSEILPHLLPALLTQHPQLSIEIAATDQVDDLLRRDADIAIRMARPRQGAIVARRIGIVDIGLFASADYLDRAPPVERIADLADHPLVADRRDGAFARLMAAAGIDHPHWGVLCDDNATQLAAIRAGAGIGAMQTILAARDPALRRVLPTVSEPLEMWVALHEDLRGVARVRAVRDHLVEGLSAILSGTDR